MTATMYTAFCERPPDVGPDGPPPGGPVVSDWNRLTPEQQARPCPLPAAVQPEPMTAELWRWLLRQGAAVRLGWNATLWDENGLPEIFVRMWEDLTDAQREDAGTLGYGKAEWEAEYTSSSDEEIPMTAADR